MKKIDNSPDLHPFIQQIMKLRFVHYFNWQLKNGFIDYLRKDTKLNAMFISIQKLAQNKNRWINDRNLWFQIEKHSINGTITEDTLTDAYEEYCTMEGSGEFSDWNEFTEYVQYNNSKKIKETVKLSAAGKQYLDNQFKKNYTREKSSYIMMLQETERALDEIRTHTPFDIDTLNLITTIIKKIYFGYYYNPILILQLYNNVQHFINNVKATNLPIIKHLILKLYDDNKEEFR